MNKCLMLNLVRGGSDKFLFCCELGPDDFVVDLRGSPATATNWWISNPWMPIVLWSDPFREHLVQEECLLGTYQFLSMLYVRSLGLHMVV